MNGLEIYQITDHRVINYNMSKSDLVGLSHASPKNLYNPSQLRYTIYDTSVIVKGSSVWNALHSLIIKYLIYEIWSNFNKKFVTFFFLHQWKYLRRFDTLIRKVSIYFKILYYYLSIKSKSSLIQLQLYIFNERF